MTAENKSETDSSTEEVDKSVKKSVKIDEGANEVGEAATTDRTPPRKIIHQLSKRPAYSRRGSQIDNGGINWGVPTNSDAKDHVEDKHGGDSLKYKVIEVLHSMKVQATMVSLLLLDVLIIFIEIFLLATYPPCDLIHRDAINCCEPTSHDGERFLAGDDGHGHGSVCEDPSLVPIYDTEAGCDSHKWSNVHTAEEVLFSLTIFILALFFVELNVEMWALGPCAFFRQFFFALDYFIITLSLVLEISFHILSQQSFEAVAGMLLIVRVWRFIRIGHGIVEVAHEVAHHEYTNLLSYTEELEDILRENYKHELPDHPIRHSSDDILGEIEKKHRDKIRKKRAAARCDSK